MSERSKSTETCVKLSEAFFHSLGSSIVPLSPLFPQQSCGIVKFDLVENGAFLPIWLPFGNLVTLFSPSGRDWSPPFYSCDSKSEPMRR